MDARAERALQVAAAALVVAFFAWIALEMGGPDVTQWADNLMLSVVPLGAAAACFLAARGLAGNARLAWVMLGASAASWGLGQVAWSWYELALGIDVPFPSLADIGYLGAIPLAVAGALLLAPAERGASARVRVVLDGIVMGLALLLISWFLVLENVLGAGAESALAAAIGVAYPMGDVLVATVALHAIARTPPAHRGPVWLLAGGLLAMAIADSGFVVLATTGAYATGNLIDVGWLAGYLLVGLGAVRAMAPTRPAAPMSARDDAFGIFLPYVPFTLGLFVSAGALAADKFDHPVPLWTAFFLFVFVAGRQLLALLDNAALVKRLGETNAEMQRLTDFRTQLLNNVSHDLATPLTPIVLQLHVLQNAPLDEPRRKSIALVKRNVEQLQRLVLDVKDVARLQSGGFTLVPREVDLSALALAATESFAGAASARGIRLEARVAPGLFVRADPERVTQIVFNLVTNALKFTPEGGSVVLEAIEHGVEFVVRVRDSGRGLSPEEMARLFQPFSQVHDPSESKEKGSGLGLYISRGIALQHGGRLWCESEGRGKGSTFSLSLPRGGPPARPDIERVLGGRGAAA